MQALLICSVLTAAAVTADSSWKLQRGDLAEYRVLTVKLAASDVHCMTAAENADAVRFDAAAGSCTLLACDRGPADGCRKCRHLGNSSLPQLWMREPVNCWTTFQHRVDGSVSFNRGWSEYVNGFGQGESLNYWMGLEQLHQLTATGVWRVRWEFSDWNGTWYWVENAPFSVGPAADKYRCSMGPPVSNRSNIGQRDHVNWLPSGQQFSTPDSDNDAYSAGNCAQSRSAGWWYAHCAVMDPNAVYKNAPHHTTGGGLYYLLYDTGVLLTTSYSMKTFECLIINS